MKYALLFYSPPHTEIPQGEREATIGKMLEAMGRWIGDLEQAGVFRSTLRLAPVDAAHSVRREAGEVLVTDGPFAETKEILGGLLILECYTLEEALGWARRCPLNAIGTVELRPEWPPGT
jgi:hypothetical protein